MTTKKTTPTKTPATFYLDIDQLDPAEIVPDVLVAGTCSPEYVALVRDFGRLQLTTDHTLDVLEAWATHAEDSNLPTAAATFRAMALDLRSTFVNKTLADIVSQLQVGQYHGQTPREQLLPYLTQGRTMVASAKQYVASRYATATHLAEVFGLDAEYTSGDDDDDDDDETEE